MPVQECDEGGKPGYRWGSAGKCYVYAPGDAKGRARAKLKAFKQGMAIGDAPTGGEMAENGVGLHITLKGAQIDGEGLSWIEVMPTIENARNGDWYFTVSAEDLSTLADYIGANPDRIPIDYDHAGAERGDTRAAGWFTGEAHIVQAGEQNPDGGMQDRPSVWAQVKWTPTAVEEIRGGDFRFISPEWHFGEKDAKTGLMTRLKDLAAATLTNRPFFKDLAPVKAMLESEQIDAITEEHGDEIADLVLAAAAASDEELAKKIEAVLGAVWTTSYINDLPDSSFLYIEAGGEKDSDGKTTPRSLRHFPVKDANGSADLAHVRNALARIPQSNVPADAKAKATAAAQRLLRNAGGNPSAADQGDHESKGDPVSDDTGNENKVTDYMRMLGLDETVDPKARIATAMRDKDDKILALTQELTELRAGKDKSTEEAEQLNARVEELEQRDRERDIEVILTRAVEKGRVLPAEKETLAEIFAKDVDGLRRMIATRPAEMFVAEAKGTTGDFDRFVDDPDVQQYAKTFRGEDPVDTEQAKIHLQAMQILNEQGKASSYTDDEYVEAYEKASKTLVY